MLWPARLVCRALRARACGKLLHPALGAPHLCRALASLPAPELSLREWRRRQKVVVVTGPTAVGKTAVSLALAELLDGEVISADSVQVYKGLDIGSDKVPVAERRGIPHHLIDVLEPHQDFSAGDFYDLARPITDKILQRGRTPVVVGGTGFYLRWYVHGKPKTPRSTHESATLTEQTLERALAEAEAAKGAELSEAEQWEAGVAAVAAAGDPEAAARLREEPNNRYRLLRMLEVALTTGRPRAELDHDRAAPPDYDFRRFFLTRPREELYRRIDARCERIAADGLLPEAQALLDRGLAADGCCAARAIGYRQALLFLQRCHADVDAATGANLVGMVQEMQSATRQLCHSQLSWFRGEPAFRWVDATPAPQDVAAAIAAEFASSSPPVGLQQGDGRLSAAEERAMRRYRPRLQLWSSAPQQAAGVEWVRGAVLDRQPPAAGPDEHAAATVQAA